MHAREVLPSNSRAELNHISAMQQMHIFLTESRVAFEFSLAPAKNTYGTNCEPLNKINCADILNTTLYLTFWDIIVFEYLARYSSLGSLFGMSVKFGVMSLFSTVVLGEL